MSADTNNKNSKKINVTNLNADGGSDGQTVEVLYQKMGSRWFAFSMIDNEVFVGSIDQNEIDESVANPNASNDAGNGNGGMDHSA